MAIYSYNYGLSYKYGAVKLPFTYNFIDKLMREFEKVKETKSQSFQN